MKSTQIPVTKKKLFDIINYSYLKKFLITPLTAFYYARVYFSLDREENEIISRLFIKSW